MLHDLSKIGDWAGNANKAIASGSGHLMSFNEPDMSADPSVGGSNILPSDAATQHIANMNPFAGKAKIGSPAVSSTQDTSGKGLDWLQQFITACAGNCKIDFVSLHWYGPSSAFQNLQDYIESGIKIAQALPGSPKVWLTEFAATDANSAEAHASFIELSTAWLDAQPMVERYAYQYADTTLTTNGAINAAGEAFISA